MHVPFLFCFRSFDRLANAGQQATGERAVREGGSAPDDSEPS